MNTMRRTILVGLACCVGWTAGAGFDDDFTGATLRVDYLHTGTASEEHFALHRMRIEGAWPGSRTQLIDGSNLGKYLVEVVDLKSNRVLYTRGFASIYGEWETTGEARRGFWRAEPQPPRRTLRSRSGIPVRRPGAECLSTCASTRTWSASRCIGRGWR